MDQIQIVGDVAGGAVSADAGSRGRRRAESDVPAGGSRAAARQPAREPARAEEQPGADCLAGHGRGALRPGASVRLHSSSAPKPRTRRSRATRWSTSGSSTSCRAMPRWSSSARSRASELEAMTAKAFAGWTGKAAARAPRCRRRARHQRQARHRRHAGRRPDAGARRQRRRAEIDARLRGARGDEHPARRAVHQPDQPEPARGQGLHLRRVLDVRVQAGGRARSSSGPASAPTPPRRR